MKTRHAKKIRRGIILADMWVDVLANVDPETAGPDAGVERARRIAETASSFGRLTWRAFDRRASSYLVPTVRL